MYHMTEMIKFCWLKVFNLFSFFFFLFVKRRRRKKKKVNILIQVNWANLDKSLYAVTDKQSENRILNLFINVCIHIVFFSSKKNKKKKVGSYQQGCHDDSFKLSLLNKKKTSLGNCQDVFVTKTRLALTYDMVSSYRKHSPNPLFEAKG